jgi:polynucleotide 5'-kinase involved in rRNA processing
MPFFFRFERVAYLECDIGQSEFTPGGMVALNVISEYQFGTHVHLFTHTRSA